jgi:hypothetical protein
VTWVTKVTKVTVNLSPASLTSRVSPDSAVVAEPPLQKKKRISRPRALHHHSVAAVPAKAILRISARLRPTSAACFLPSCTRSRKLWAGRFFKRPAEWGISG